LEVMAMNHKRWELFFDILCEIVDLEGLSYTEKLELVKAKAHEYGESGEIALDEFTSWGFGTE